MKLDLACFRYLTAIEWRVLVAVEMGMRNHQIVPTVLITRIANFRRQGIHKVLSSLLKYKLLSHEASVYDGYKLSYLGYDLLAIRAFVSRGTLSGVGTRIGVGKESDVHLCEKEPNKYVIVKLHRLGRISFRSVKKNRDYLGNRQSSNWMYLARLAAAKEYAYMKALYEHGFPVPEPIDLNRHVLVMSYINARPLAHVSELKNPYDTLENLMRLIIQFAEAGLIHGDFNQFNLLIHEDDSITVIDFPQIISVHHPDAKFYFDRDVQCIRTLFKSRFGIHVVEYPEFHKVNIPPPLKPIKPRTNCLSEEQRLIRELEELTLHKENENESDILSSSSSNKTCSDDSSETLNSSSVSHLKDPLDLSEKQTQSSIEKPNESEKSIYSSKRFIAQNNLLLSNEKEISFQKLCSKNKTAKESLKDSDHLSQESNECELLQESDENSEQLTLTEQINGKTIPCRLDNVWTPIVRRRLSKKVQDRALKEKKKKFSIKGSSRKQKAEKRHVDYVIKNDW